MGYFSFLLFLATDLTALWSEKMIYVIPVFGIYWNLCFWNNIISLYKCHSWEDWHLKLLVQFLNMSMSNMSQTILIILFELSYPYQFCLTHQLILRCVRIFLKICYLHESGSFLLHIFEASLLKIQKFSYLLDFPFILYSHPFYSSNAFYLIKILSYSFFSAIFTWILYFLLSF